jgi:nucleoid-associated protein YgaU
MVAVTHPATIARPARRPTGTTSAATYRRRRLVAAALLLLVLVAVANLALQLAGGAPPSHRPVVETSVVVQPGDTVWSIARSLAGDGDVRPVVDALVDVNGGAALEVGERLVVSLP